MNQMEGPFVLLLLFNFVYLSYFFLEKELGWVTFKVNSYIWQVWELHQNLLLLHFVGPVFMEKVNNLSKKLYGMLHEEWRVTRKEGSKRVGVGRWDLMEWQ